MLRLIIIVVCILGISCSSAPEKGRNLERDSIEKLNTKIVDSSLLKHRGDSVVLPSFKISVALSKKAEDKLKQKQQPVVVAAYFIGTPANSASETFSKTGEVGLAKKIIILKDTERIASFDSVKFSDALIDSIKNNDVRVMINVYNAKLSVRENFLNCNNYNDKLSAIANKTYTIKGRLLTE